MKRCHSFFIFCVFTAVWFIDSITSPALAQVDFLRGDANVDGVVDIADVSFLLELGLGGGGLTCRDAADADDSGDVGIPDFMAIANLSLGGPPLPPPGPAPGPDPTPDALDCNSYESAAPPQHGGFTLDFDCPPGLTGAPGEIVRFEAFATLTTSRAAAEEGASGWSISVGGDGLHIVSVTTAGTAVSQAGRPFFESNRVIDPASQCPQREGFISGVILTNLSGRVTLPPEGTARIARITAEVAIPPSGVSNARLFYIEDKVGFGAPVRNVIVVQGTAQKPVLGTCGIPVNGGVPDASLPADCNQNCVVDSGDIADGTSRDCNRNGVPDECDIRPELEFGPEARYGVRTQPEFLDAADLDRDGALDLAVACSLSSSVVVLRNQGNGTFALHQEVAAGQGATFPVASDLDGDEDLDLAVAIQTERQVGVLFNDGTGRLGDLQKYNIGIEVTSVAAGDLDQDGDLDLVTANFSGTDAVPGRSLSVLLNQGRGDFAAPRPVTVGTNPTVVRAVDLDADGHVDLAVSDNGAHTVWILWNRENADFEAPVPHPVGRSPYDLVAADLDGDGQIDLATADTDWELGLGSPGSVSVLLNAGKRTFLPAILHASGGRTPIGLAAADLDGDGAFDLAASGFDSTTVSVLRNRGDGSFEDGTRAWLLQVGTRPTGVVLEDFDGDAVPDLAAANRGGMGLPDGREVSVVLTRLVPGASSDSDPRNGIPDECDNPRLLRGDCNGDGSVVGDVSDSIFLLSFNFLGTEEPKCQAACDANGDGDTGGVTDAIYLLNFNFLGGAAPVPPFPACGKFFLNSDPVLGCELTPKSCTQKN